MIDCLLIHPGGVHGIDPVYGELSRSLTSLEPPMWPRIIAGYLGDRMWNVQIYDQEVEGTSHYHVAFEHVRRLEPKIVAICVYGHQPSASTQQMVNARRLAHALRDSNYPGVIVMLGNHPSALPERTLMEEPVDFVIDGEGPVTLDCLLKALIAREKCGYIDLEKIPGLVWWEYGTAYSDKIPVCNPPAPLLSMRDLHGKAWKLLPPLSRYRAHAWQCLDDQSKRTPYAAIFTSLGCPYTCSFCMINVFQHTNKYRMRDPLDVVFEITELYAKGVRTFKIIDELFVLNREHYQAICRMLADSGMGSEINIWAYARTDTIAPEDLPLMRAAGIKWLALGIESGSSTVRKSAAKALRYDKNSIDWAGNASIANTVYDIRAADINVIGNYIFGLPDDTHDTMEETLNLAQELNTEFANFYCAMPYPGSKLYDNVLKERPGDLPPSWGAYSQHNRLCTPLRNENLTAAEILRFRDEAFIKYFSSKRWRDMALAKFGPAALEHVDQMLSYKLERDLLK